MIQTGKVISHRVFRYALVARATLCLAATSVCFAAYDRPVAWDSESPVEFSSVLKEADRSAGNLLEPSIPDSAFQLALSDGKDRVDPEFRIPEGMRNSVEFWMKIYARYSSQDIVVFDETHPELVYEVIDLRDLARTARNRVVYEILAERKVKRIRAGYRAALVRLSRNPKPRKPSREEKNILAAVKLLKHPHRFSELAGNVRTQTGQRDFVINGLAAADPFMPTMEKIFAELGVPTELTRLSLVESSFNVRAVSYVGATGVWQFMLASAHEYLLVNKQIGVDERLSPLKSTVAAAKMLKRNQKLLGSWPLTITSYNHGFGKLRKIPEKDRKLDRVAAIFTGCSKNKNRYRLGWASRNYYPEFLAMLYADKYRDVFYGRGNDFPVRAVAFQRLGKKQSALAFITAHGLSVGDFVAFNPDVTNLNKPLPPHFVVVVPGDKPDIVDLIKKMNRKRAV